MRQHVCQTDELTLLGRCPGFPQQHRAGALAWLFSPKAEQRIYFANHQSHADLVGMIRRRNELRQHHAADRRRDYWTKTPSKQWITTAVFNAVRGSARKGDEDPLAPLMEALERGDSMIIFPEGIRGQRRGAASPKAGLYNLAQKFPKWCLRLRGSPTSSA